MSEKRFFILKDEEYDDVLPCIRDKQGELKDIYGHYKYDDINQICRELNALHEENEQLKHDATVLICSNQEYRKENEQLKSELKALRKYNDFSDMIEQQLKELDKRWIE